MADTVTSVPWRVHEGDCRDVMRSMDADSVDAIVTDPPYALNFMSAGWDRFASPREFQAWCEMWAVEALRVLKPGGHLLAFGGTRAQHRLVCGLEDAGFEIRDTLMWAHAQGYPKSKNVSAAIDAAAGAERPKIGEYRNASHARALLFRPDGRGEPRPMTTFDVTGAATDDAKRWVGWGSALKPSFELVVLARKPFVGTIASNVLTYGTGALNINACRVGTSGGTQHAQTVVAPQPRNQGVALKGSVDGSLSAEWGESVDGLGRWPANLILSHAPECKLVGSRVLKGDQRGEGSGTRLAGFADVEAPAGSPEPNGRVYGNEEVETWDCVETCPVRLLDEQSGECRSAGEYVKGSREQGAKAGPASIPIDGLTSAMYADSGGASRFFLKVAGDNPKVDRLFYSGKTSTAERNAGLSECLPRTRNTRKRAQQDHSGRWQMRARNTHMTVKPIELMRWLVRLVTPPNGLVLDPFAGSGSTGCAAVLEGFGFVGIERESEYVRLARARVGWWAARSPGVSVARAVAAEVSRRRVAESGQGSLLDEAWHQA